jgi:3-deoxy-D-manno-octulosonic acid (KDO) 8-phosphate synthase
MSAVVLREGVVFDNALPFVLIGGMNVIEGREVMLRVAEQLPM